MAQLEEERYRSQESRNELQAVQLRIALIFRDVLALSAELYLRIS